MLLLVLQRKMMLVLELIKQEAVYLDLLLQYSATERTSIHKGSWMLSDEKLIIKLGLQ
jgi:hypothetical protein